ncbi:head maturation protease, ClpP-related [Sagittula sp. MA-2]|jgi:ATP-dependent protease ClpP protease subunit|uniref:head maturation protease, ClpP-related n=1 Tax=Sagittula sp. MA-2 TaxID=3048007 RepID=UPI0024C46798|nr:head maturation protease, ClpP-related [Sagittula sp. MA-2]WHZ36496.1 Clp protease ClpP [Sagittula sp. MA-2]
MSVKLREIFKMNAAQDGKSWFDVTMLAERQYVVDIRGVIGDWEVDPQMLVDRLEAIDAELDGEGEVIVRIDSPGGTVSGGVSIMTALGQMKTRPIAEIWGSCYSMATMVALACDEVKIARDASMMIHNPKGLVFGTASEMKAALQYLDNVREQAIGRYAAKVEAKGHTRAEVEEAMTDAGTYYTALQAVEFGLADVILEDKRDGERMQIDREFAAVMLGDAPEEVELPIEDEASASDPDQETVEDAPAVETAPELVSVELSVNGTTISMSASAETAAALKDAGELVTKPAEIEPEMKAPEDPLVASLKSGSHEPVVTAKPDGDAASKKTAVMSAEERRSKQFAIFHPNMRH